jgi:hypothetical protein
MTFTFDVGNKERHRVVFHFNQLWGNLRITVDDQAVVRDFRMYSLHLTKKYEFPVGDSERHTVAIEHARKLLLAGFRKQKYRVYVDGCLVAEHQGF